MSKYLIEFKLEIVKYYIENKYGYETTLVLLVFNDG